MTQPAPLPIHTDDFLGGALNWFDLMDTEGRVRVILVGNPIPSAVEKHPAWVKKALKEDHRQPFFFMPRALSTAPMAFHLEKPSNEKYQSATVGSAHLCLPLTQLFLLPNENPAEELAQMKAFLTWLDDRLKGQNKDGDDATICWSKVGHVDLHPMYFKDEEARRALEADLKAWRNQPWFEAWFQANAAALKRLPRDRHFWFDLSSLVPCRRSQRLAALHASEPPKDPDEGKEWIILDI